MRHGFALLLLLLLLFKTASISSPSLSISLRCPDLTTTVQQSKPTTGMLDILSRPAYLLLNIRLERVLVPGSWMLQYLHLSSIRTTRSVDVLLLDSNIGSESGSGSGYFFGSDFRK